MVSFEGGEMRCGGMGWCGGEGGGGRREGGTIGGWVGGEAGKEERRNGGSSMMGCQAALWAGER